MRKLGVLCVAIGATLALVTAAPVALASYDSEVAEVSWSGSGAAAQVFVTKFGKIKCTGSSFTATVTGSEEEEGVFVSETVSVHPSYSGCTAFGQSATMTTTGCNYEFGSTAVAEGTGGSAVAGIACSGTNKIRVESLGCTMLFGSQSNIGNVEFMNTGTEFPSRTITTVFAASNLAYEGSGAICPGSGSGGSYTGEVPIKGLQGATQRGIWVETEVPPDQYHLDAVNGKVESESPATAKFTFGVGVVTNCSVNFKTSLANNGTFPELPLGFKNASESCTGPGTQTPTLDTNSCRIKLGVPKPVMTFYQAQMRVVCGVGKVLDFTFGVTCAIEITGQDLTVVGRAKLENLAGPPKQIKVTWEVDNLIYKSNTNMAPCGGSGTNGLLQGTVVLNGYTAAGAAKDLWIDI